MGSNTLLIIVALELSHNANVFPDQGLGSALHAVVKVFPDFYVDAPGTIVDYVGDVRLLLGDAADPSDEGYVPDLGAVDDVVVCAFELVVGFGLQELLDVDGAERLVAPGLLRG